MENTSSLITSAKSTFTPNYNQAGFVISHGKGSYLFDLEGKKYLDFSSGIAVNNFGHCHPSIVSAVKAQSEKLLHCSNLFWNLPSIQLAERLKKLSSFDRVFFSNSGTEANEGALKIARKFFFDQKKPRSRVVSFEHGFHGRTFGSLSATHKKAFQEPFGPMVPGFECAPLGSLDKITDDTAAVVIEPVQGEAGVLPVTKEFLIALRKRTEEVGAVLIFDCIQVGFGRTGSLFGFENSGVAPDIITLAKGIGGGLPLGAILSREKFGSILTVGSHGTTFGGNPVSCAAGNAVLDILTADGFLKDVQRKSDLIYAGLHALRNKISLIRDIRIQGLMIGVDLTEDIAPHFDQLRDAGLLLTRVPPKTFRILPPLTCSDAEIEEFLKIFGATLAKAKVAA